MTNRDDGSNRGNPGPRVASCACGRVTFELTGKPILSAACYCTSCQEAGRLLDAPSPTPGVVGRDGGTEYVLFRKDRVRLVTGAEQLEAHRLKPESPTRRVRAKCCQSAMFLDMTKGHWLSIYRARIVNGAPPIEMRVMTNERPVGEPLATDVANYAAHSGQFMLRLLGAWLAMGFRRPKVDF
jgi:hypothetical protein